MRIPGLGGDVMAKLGRLRITAVVRSMKTLFQVRLMRLNGLAMER